MQGLVAGRFEIERELRSGWMSRVYRAVDRTNGQPVALKLMRPPADVRFAHEAQVLASLGGIGLVPYVAHGAIPSGEPFLATKWVEGESLAARLQQGRRALDEVTGFARRVAQILAALHARGFVHRDLRPSKILWSPGKPEQATVLEFPVAHREEITRVTRAGALVSTPAYMAPEQVRGAIDLDARADVFALGCILFECFAGVPAFRGDSPLAILTKVLVDKPPQLETLRPDVPSAWADLVGKMLSKDREQRPKDGAAVLAAIASLSGAPPSRRSVSSTNDRVTAVVIGERTHVVEPALADATVDAEARKLAVACGARFERLGNGALVAVFSGHGAASEIASAAAAFALRSRTLFNEKAFSIALARSGDPIGEMVDRAVGLLTRSPGTSTIVVDDVGASILGAAFDVRDSFGCFEVGEAKKSVETVYRVLGRPTPCVGRERDVATVVGIADECFADLVARAAIITAPAGIGKSRLVNEALRSIRIRRPEATIAIVRSNPIGGGTPYSLAAELLRQLGVDKTDDELFVDEPSEDGPVLTRALMREMAGLSTLAADRHVLAAARSDPRVFADSVRNAWVDTLRRLTGWSPLVLVIEDLQWGDLPSIALIDAALGRLGETQLFVLATARPDVAATMPGIWARHPLHWIRLGPLSEVAAAQLVRSVVPNVPEATLYAIVERAGGHPFFLEEIVRAVAAGAPPSVIPDNIIATTQLRIGGLGKSDQVTVRAASVFGPTFWKGGVMALRGSSDLDPAFARLVELELIDRSPSRDDELVFRHPLVCEAAYAQLGLDDRARAHAAAAEWLERGGKTDASVLADHYDRADVHDRALHYSEQAAQLSLNAHDLTRALALVDRARSHADSDERSGGLDAIEAEIWHLRGDAVSTTAIGERALARLPQSKRAWFRTACVVITSAGNQGDHECVARWADLASRSKADEDARGEQVIAIARAVSQLASAHDLAHDEALHARLIEIAPDPLAFAPHIAGVIHRARAFHALWANSDLWRFRDEAKVCVEAFERAGVRADWLNARILLAGIRAQIGEMEGAEKELRAVVQETEPSDTRHGFALVELGRSLALHRRGDEAIALLDPALEAYRGSERLVFHARHALAMAALATGDARRALREAELAANARVNPMLRARAIAVGAQARLALREVQKAIEHSRYSVDLVVSIPGWEPCTGHCELAWAEALEASGATEHARGAITRALGRLSNVAAHADSEAARAAFMAVPLPNARIVEVARRLGVAE